MTTSTAIPSSVLHRGKLYAFYAGPFHDLTDAYDRVEHYFAHGAFSESDDPIVLHGSIYIRLEQ